MNKIAIPALLLGVVMIAGAFAILPVQEASTVHTTIQANTMKFSAIVLTSTDIDTNDVIITCPATSEGCTIGDVIVHDQDAAQDVTINSIDYTASDITGDPVIITVGIQEIDANGAELLQNIGGITMAAGDIVRIDFDDPAAATLVDVQVTAYIEGGIADITLGVIVH